MKRATNIPSDASVLELCPIIDEPAILADDGEGPWCPEDYDPDFLPE